MKPGSTTLTDRWIEIYRDRNALWIHDGNPKRPHALLTSGKHSDGFFNSGLVTEDPFLLHAACQDLRVLLQDQFNTRMIKRVVGPAMGAITMAHCIAYSINQSFGASDDHHNCLSAFTEKESDSASKRMILKRFALRPGELVLPVEDVLTTGGSVELTATAVAEAGGALVPFVCVLVNRSGLAEVGGKKIVALIDRPMPMWTLEECPLCKQGSVAIRPKDNWAALNADY